MSTLSDSKRMQSNNAFSGSVSSYRTPLVWQIAMVCTSPAKSI